MSSKNERIALPPPCSRCCRLRIFGSIIFGIAPHVQHYTGEDARSLRFMDSVAGQQDWNGADKLGGDWEEDEVQRTAKHYAIMAVTAKMLG